MPWRSCSPSYKYDNPPYLLLLLLLLVDLLLLLLLLKLPLLLLLLLQVGPLFTYLAPLAFVLLATLAKEAYDDIKRY